MRGRGTERGREEESTWRKPEKKREREGQREPEEKSNDGRKKKRRIKATQGISVTSFSVHHPEIKFE